jgi:phage-related protein
VDVVRDVVNWFKHFGDHAKEAGAVVQTAWNNTIAFFKGIGQRIKDAIGDTFSLLIHSGEQLIEGLIKGIQNKLGPLGGAISNVAQFIKDHFPHSPAKLGPLSGSGSMYFAGQNLIKQLQEGISSQQAGLGTSVNASASTTRQALSSPMATNVPTQIFNITTQEISPRRHAAELGFALAGR